MKKYKKMWKALGLIIILFSLVSCNKYLEKKPLKSLKVPAKLDDLQAILNSDRMYAWNTNMPEVLADNYYVEASAWLAATETQGKFLYNWEPYAQSESTWSGIYSQIVYNTNVVLDELQNFEATIENRGQYNSIKNQALFYRAFAFYQLAQLYCKPYSESAKNDLGIPLRTTAAIETRSVRATVQETYDKIIGDFLLTLEWLPDQPDFPTQPSKAAVYGLLSRCYLSMRDYKNAGKYANLCLEVHSELIDYNDIKTELIPFKRFNKETVFYGFCSLSSGIMTGSRGRIDTLLYKSYADYDLRKMLFFMKMTGANAGSYSFVGCYDGNYHPPGVFNGITTGEMYLNRAECYARDGKKELALADLNALMKNRWDNSVPYPTITAVSADEALEKVLVERRKELVFRGLRWSDLRRFNLEGRNITLERNVNGQKYLLSPNDPRWVLLIPDNVINLSGMPQNPRNN